MGKTLPGFVSGKATGKHPHVRGEDPHLPSHQEMRKETPPRTWGRPLSDEIPVLKGRNTPTYVGKTGAGCCCKRQGWKHPHVRGEDNHAVNFLFRALETPPRTWGRPFSSASASISSRNTPTYVGKTQSTFLQPRATRKHPHVRGEDEQKLPLRAKTGETPPRTWGRQRRGERQVIPEGNTPTYVGKTCLRRKHG